MTDSREVYSWPEATFYAFSGGASAAIAYAENVEIVVDRKLSKFLGMTTGAGYAARSQYVETDKDVRLTCGRLFAGPSFFFLMGSGVNVSATVNFLTLADGATAQFTLWSAQIPHWQIAGREGAVWRESISMMAPDISGV